MTIPVPSAALVTKDGTPTLPLRQWMQEVQRVADGAASKVTAAAVQTDTLSIVIARPKDGDTVILRPFATGATVTVNSFFKFIIIFYSSLICELIS